ncbi:retrovirus-related pol polyprotein from transposon TNT 1-94 [Tanacetum coccineum]
MPLGFRISEEEWQGKEVSLAHLKVFGCDSYVKVKDVARDKLDAKSMKCTFIGYGSNEMGYRFWDSKGHKVIRSRDVTFNEDSLYGAKAPQQILSPCGSSDTSEGSKNGGSFKDNGRSYEEDSKDGASSEEEGFKTPHVRRSSRESRAPWKKDINEEMVSLEKNQTWSLVRLPAGKKALQSKLVFRIKEEQNDRKRYKARLVVKGFQQKRGVDYNEIFSPVVNMTTIRAGYKRCAIDHCCYLKKVGSCSIILLLYVDDMLVAGSDMAEIKKLKRKLSQEFEMKDLGSAKQILVGSLMYAMVCTRPDIAHEIGVVSRFMSNLGREHWEAVKWLLLYLKGTLKATLCFSRKEVVLEGFSYSNYGCDTP